MPMFDTLQFVVSFDTWPPATQGAVIRHQLFLP